MASAARNVAMRNARRPSIAPPFWNHLIIVWERSRDRPGCIWNGWQQDKSSLLHARFFGRRAESWLPAAVHQRIQRSGLWPFLQKSNAAVNKRIPAQQRAAMIPTTATLGDAADEFWHIRLQSAFTSVHRQIGVCSSSPPQCGAEEPAHKASDSSECAMLSLFLLCGRHRFGPID